MSPNTSPISDADTAAALRKSVYTILILIALGGAVGRIFAVKTVDESTKYEGIRFRLYEQNNRLIREHRDGWSQERIDQEIAERTPEYLENSRSCRPGLSANDRSRWCTIRALVEPDMRVEREVVINDEVRTRRVWYAIDNVQSEPGWDTIDMVKHRLPDDPDGTGYLFSSKPPLLPTLMAIPYAAIYYGSNEKYSMATHPFAVARVLLVLYNVIPMAIMLFLIAGWAERYGKTGWGGLFVVATACFGTLLTTFVITINNHLAGAVCLAIAMDAALRIWLDGDQRLRWFVLAGFFAAFSVACELPAAAFFFALGIALLLLAPKQTLLAGAPAALLIGIGFFGTNWIAHKDLEPPYAHRMEGRDWTNGNWYIYTYDRGNRKDLSSHWLNTIGTIDEGEVSRGDYILHTTIGHHGVVSLTPVWLLAFAGIGIWLRRPPNDKEFYRWISAFILGLSLIVFVFFMTQGQGNRNYGGVTSGFRWMFFLAPLWLLTMLPAADWASRKKWSRGLAGILLACSMVSVTYPTWNPWSHPWIWNFMDYLGLLSW